MTACAWPNLENFIMKMIDALKMAYRKYCLNDESIGWDELSDCLLAALCNELGDDEYQKWISSIAK